MSVKRYLQQVELADVRIERIEERLDEIMTTLTKATADPSKERTSGGTGQTMETLVAHLIETQTELEHAKAEAVDVRAKITAQIMQLDNVAYIRVLDALYVNYKGLPAWSHGRLQAAAARADYSEAHYSTLHGRALQAFGEKFAKEVER